LAQGVDAVSQSFVENGADVVTVRRAAADLGQRLFLIAKIERYGALAHLDEIVREADGIMIARGDLGVEAPIEEIALLQKKLIGIANQAGKPVITATQMLESMTSNRLPTRAEATDVANAILDGTDAVMLSGESAVGMFPEEAVAMLGKIAALTEPHRTRVRPPQPIQTSTNSNLTAFERLAKFAEHALDAAPCDAVIVPTRTGTTARAIARSRPPVWIIAVGPDSVTQQGLAFSYGVHPLVLNEDPEDWAIFAKHSMPQLGIAGRHAMLVAGPSPRHPLAHHRLEIFELSSE
jgi:pyruvate kinase